jgi:hypothetical protein
MGPSSCMDAVEKGKIEPRFFVHPFSSQVTLPTEPSKFVIIDIPNYLRRIIQIIVRRTK